MHILYGVQGTGNGHLSRARAMGPALTREGIRVDWLVSGRPPDKLFHMEDFAPFSTRRGLSFVYIDGCVSYLRTVLSNNYPQFLRDVWNLDVSGYDLIVTDFEPITAWAGKLRGRTVVSMGHQPAFDYPVPVAGRDFLTTMLMRIFAPGSIRVGMHWDHFDAPLLPPLVDVGHVAQTRIARKVLVYLPFENAALVNATLAGIPGYEFYVYAPANAYLDQGSMHFRPTSLHGFRADLADCDAVVCNAGFELASESLALGKRLLVKPLSKQMEQTSNALALELLGFASTLHAIDSERIQAWLDSEAPVPRVEFPDVASALAKWLAHSNLSQPTVQSLSDTLWSDVRISRGQ